MAAAADLRIAPLDGSHERAGARLVDEVLGGRYQARLGSLVDVLALQGYGAWLSSGELVGLATWSGGPDESGRGELVALAVGQAYRGLGIGGRLLEAVVAAGRGCGCPIVWLVTTNDNLDALRLYQRHGFVLAELRVNGVAESRKVKPTIPESGQHGIAMRDELVLERVL